MFSIQSILPHSILMVSRYHVEKSYFILSTFIIQRHWWSYWIPHNSNPFMNLVLFLHKQYSMVILYLLFLDLPQFPWLLYNLNSALLGIYTTTDVYEGYLLNSLRFRSLFIMSQCLKAVVLIAICCCTPNCYFLYVFVLLFYWSFLAFVSTI